MKLKELYEYGFTTTHSLLRELLCKKLIDAEGMSEQGINHVKLIHDIVSSSLVNNFHTALNSGSALLEKKVYFLDCTLLLPMEYTVQRVTSCDISAFSIYDNLARNTIDNDKIVSANKHKLWVVWSFIKNITRDTVAYDYIDVGFSSNDGPQEIFISFFYEDNEPCHIRLVKSQKSIDFEWYSDNKYVNNEPKSLLSFNKIVYNVSSILQCSDSELYKIFEHLTLLDNLMSCDSFIAEKIFEKEIIEAYTQDIHVASYKLSEYDSIQFKNFYVSLQEEIKSIEMDVRSKLVETVE